MRSGARRTFTFGRVAGVAHFRRRRRAALPRPPERGEGGETDGAAAQPPRHPRLLRLRRQQLAIGRGGVGWLERSGPPPSLGRRNPAGDVPEPPRTARRARLRVVHFVAVHTQPGYVQLHASVYTPRVSTSLDRSRAG